MELKAKASSSTDKYIITAMYHCVHERGFRSYYQKKITVLNSSNQTSMEGLGRSPRCQGQQIGFVSPLYDKTTVETANVMVAIHHMNCINQEEEKKGGTRTNKSIL